jgi:YcxB-like protein
MAGEVHFTPSLADFVSARRDVYSQFLHSGRGRAGYLILVLIFIAMGIAEALLLNLDWLLWNIVGFGFIGLVTSAALIGITWLFLPRRSRRLFEQSKTMHQQFRYGWSDGGLSFRSANGSGDVPWPMLHGWYRGRANMLFYFNQGLCHFIPLRALDDAGLSDLAATLERSGLRQL